MSDEKEVVYTKADLLDRLKLVKYQGFDLSEDKKYYTFIAGIDFPFKALRQYWPLVMSEVAYLGKQLVIYMETNDAETIDYLK